MPNTTMPFEAGSVSASCLTQVQSDHASCGSSVVYLALRAFARRGRLTLGPTGIGTIGIVHFVVLKNPGPPGSGPTLMRSRPLVEIGTLAAAIDRGVCIPCASFRYQGRS